MKMALLLLALAIALAAFMIYRARFAYHGAMQVDPHAAHEIQKARKH